MQNRLNRTTAVFRCDGDYWTVAYADTVLRLKDSRGLQYVARLLRHRKDPNVLINE